MHYVYRGINRTKQEVYHGVSKYPIERQNGSHCVGGTKAVAHWDCAFDMIRWSIVSKHYKQKLASTQAHFLERNYRHYKGFTNILTAGI